MGLFERNKSLTGVKSFECVSVVLLVKNSNISFLMDVVMKVIDSSSPTLPAFTGRTSQAKSLPMLGRAKLTPDAKDIGASWSSSRDVPQCP